MITLSNKTALITGGSRGIGRACVEYFLEAGAKVAFTYTVNKTSADNLIAQYPDKMLKAYKVDVSSEDEIESCVENVINDFGSIDILVNNAGIWKHSPIDKMTLEKWNETININLTGTYLFTKYVVPEMKAKKGGRIINIASTAGQRGEAEYSHYASSKGGVIAFTKSLATELGKYNINVNCVAPGWVLTDMTQHIFDNEEERKKELSIIPLGRVAMPEDIAGPVLFLASGLANHITGEILNVNGGSVLCG